MLGEPRARKPLDRMRNRTLDRMGADAKVLAGNGLRAAGDPRQGGGLGGRISVATPGFCETLRSLRSLGRYGMHAFRVRINARTAGADAGRTTDAPRGADTDSILFPTDR